jgi:hypothetical protein
VTTYPPPKEPDYSVEKFAPQQNSVDPSIDGANAGSGAGPNGSAPAAPAAPAAYTPELWPSLDKAALYGLAGEVVDRLAPQTESDPAALLLTYLTSFGNAIGRGPYYEVEATQHFANLFALLVGDTAKARKGTSTRHIRSILELADAEWARERIRGGMSSGEGVIAAVRDPGFALRKGVLEMVDPGVTDKRLLLYEPSFPRCWQCLPGGQHSQPHCADARFSPCWKR